MPAANTGAEIDGSGAGGVWLPAVAGLVYLATMLPGTGHSGDVAKFQFLGHVLGTSHATGYPLYTLLNALWVRILPFGSLAWRANLLSLVFGIAALAVFFRVASRLTRSSLPAVTATGILAFTPSFWTHCLIAEVYTLHLLLMLLVMLFALRWENRQRPRDLAIAGCWMALSFSHHLTAIMLVPPLLMYVLLQNPRAPFDTTVWRPVCLTGAITMTLYLYIPWRSNLAPAPYIEMSATSWSEFWYYLRGAQFAPAMFPFSMRQFFCERLPLVALILFDELYLLFPFALAFIPFSHMSARHFLLAGYLVTTIGWSANYDIHDLEVYFLPAVTILLLYLTRGMDGLLHAVPLRIRRLVLFCMACLPLAMLLRNFHHVRLDRENGIHSEITMAMQALPEHAVILPANYDYAEFWWYYLLGENRRPNADVLWPVHAQRIELLLLQSTPLSVRETGKRLDAGRPLLLHIPQSIPDREEAMHLRQSLQASGNLTLTYHSPQWLLVLPHQTPERIP